MTSQREMIDQAVAGQTVPRQFLRTVSTRADKTALRWLDGSDWQQWTWSQFAEQACRIAAGLRNVGVRPGDQVMTLLPSCPEFYAVDMAVQLVGATPVAIFNSSSAEQIAHFAKHSGAVALVVSTGDVLERVLRVRSELSGVRAVITVGNDAPSADGLFSYEQLASAAPLDLDEALRNVTPDSLAALIYTSGTTGAPKAAMLSQRNVCWMIEATGRAMGTTMADWRVISYMPMAHVAERTLSYWLQVIHGGEVSICPSPQRLAEVLVQVRPHFFGAVPRIWEKMHAGIMTALAGDAAKRAEFEDALLVGLQVGRLQLAGSPVETGLRAMWVQANEILTPSKALVGLDACRMALTGSAPTPPEIFDFFLGLGIPISETYGFSEGGQTTGWSFTDIRPGTIGKPLPGNAIRTLEDGELVIRGGSIFTGYLNDPEKTKAALDDDGWYHTGDVGSIDDDGYVCLRDRKKELIITSTGENISPVNVQNTLNACDIIGQTCVVGDGRPHITALITLSPEFLTVWAKGRGIDATDLAALARDPRVREEVERQIGEVNQRLSRLEQVKKFTILPHEWLPDSDELTPTAKIKRRVVLTKYAEEIEELYR
jgi:long-chain acyl-CoA synthetase